MKIARSIMAAAVALAAMTAVAAPTFAASKTVVTRSNGACTTKRVTVREHGVRRVKVVRNCAPVVHVAPRYVAPHVVIRTPVVSSRVVVRAPAHRCVTKTVVEHNVRRTRKVCT